MDQQQIDRLLQHYLGLLDDYTRLRRNLCQLQSGIYQDIARANFSGERGMRYGQDHYDDRMQALRLLGIEMDDKTQLPSFSVVDAPEEMEPQTETEQDSSGEPSEDQATEKKPTEQAQAAQETRKMNKNPLRWFGLFAPMPLRTAQTQSVRAVEEIIPKLVSVNAEMHNVEIEIRRARKRRTKAQVAEKKTLDEAETRHVVTEVQTTPVDAT